MIGNICAVLRERFPMHCCKEVAYAPNRGKGWAIFQGLLQVEAPWVLTLDADFSSTPCELLFWEAEGWIDYQADKVFIASREAGIERGWVSRMSIRRIIGLIYNFLVRMSSGISFRDTQCGFKLYPAERARHAFKDLMDYGFAHDLEVLMKLSRTGVEIVSLPVHWTASDESKVNIVFDSVKMFQTLLRLRKRYGRD